MCYLCCRSLLSGPIKINKMADKEIFDVIIIGGSYAGLSAAMALGRSLRRVLVLDSGKPCNRQTPHSHNFITQDGERPAVIAAKAKVQVMQYNSVSSLEALAIKGEKTENGFGITTDGGYHFEAKKLIFATGVSDMLPEVKGVAECWGISLVHCPYCHGYEFSGRPTGIWANGDRAFHLSGLVKNLTNDVRILTSGAATFSLEQRAKLQQHDIPVIEAAIMAVEHENGVLRNVVLEDGSKQSFDAVYTSFPFEQHSDIPGSLGCKLTEQGHISVDMFQKTSVAGVFACGDNSSMLRSVANAVSAGNLAGAMVNKELVDESF